MIDSSRFDNRPAWFSGDSETGDYYDEKTGRYLGSWSRAKGDFVDQSRTEEILFDLDAWKNRHKKPQTLVSKIVEHVSEIIVPKPDPEPVNPLTLPGKYIAFIGDSFCAAIDKSKNQAFFEPKSTHFIPFRHSVNTPTWPSLVADAMSLNIAPYGFGGRSWWYSWTKFWDEWKDRLSDLEAVVFVHSHWCRINHSQSDDLPLSPGFESLFSNFPSEKIQAAKFFHAYVADRDFQRWSQRQFFHYIARALPNIKTVHLFAFCRPTQETLGCLPGTKFITPLALLSTLENDCKIKGSSLPRIPGTDERPNHFNDHNNTVLARHVIKALKKKSQGSYELPWQEFDIKNGDKISAALDLWWSTDLDWI